MQLNTSSGRSNNAIILADKAERDAFLSYTNDNGVMTRPIWRLMSELDMFNHCQRDGLENSRWLEERVVNVPSSVPENAATPANARGDRQATTLYRHDLLISI